MDVEETRKQLFDNSRRAHDAHSVLRSPARQEPRGPRRLADVPAVPPPGVQIAATRGASLPGAAAVPSDDRLDALRSGAAQALQPAALGAVVGANVAAQDTGPAGPAPLRPECGGAGGGRGVGPGILVGIVPINEIHECMDRHGGALLPHRAPAPPGEDAPDDVQDEDEHAMPFLPIRPYAREPFSADVADTERTLRQQLCGAVLRGIPASVSTFLGAGFPRIVLHTSVFRYNDARTIASCVSLPDEPMPASSLRCADRESLLAALSGPGSARCFIASVFRNFVRAHGAAHLTTSRTFAPPPVTAQACRESLQALRVLGVVPPVADFSLREALALLSDPALAPRCVAGSTAREAALMGSRFGDAYAATAAMHEAALGAERRRLREGHRAHRRCTRAYAALVDARVGQKHERTTVTLAAPVESTAADAAETRRAHAHSLQRDAPRTGPGAAAAGGALRYEELAPGTLGDGFLDAGSFDPVAALPRLGDADTVEQRLGDTRVYDALFDALQTESATSDPAACTGVLNEIARTTLFTHPAENCFHEQTPLLDEVLPSIRVATTPSEPYQPAALRELDDFISRDLRLPPGDDGSCGRLVDAWLSLGVPIAERIDYFLALARPDVDLPSLAGLFARLAAVVSATDSSLSAVQERLALPEEHLRVRTGGGDACGAAVVGQRGALQEALGAIRANARELRSLFNEIRGASGIAGSCRGASILEYASTALDVAARCERGLPPGPAA